MTLHSLVTLCTPFLALACAAAALSCDRATRTASDTPPANHVIAATTQPQTSVVLDQRVGRATEAVPEVSVSLLRPVGDLEGVTWPREYDPVSRKDNQPRRWIVEQRPHRLTVQLPGGGSLSHYSRATFFAQESGIVNSVEFMPLQSNVPFQQAVSELEKLFWEWNVQPDDRGRQAIERWKADGDVRPDPFLVQYGGYAAIPDEDRVLVDFQIRPVRDQGWYLVINVGLTMAEHAKLWQHSRSATTMSGG